MHESDTQPICPKTPLRRCSRSFYRDRFRERHRTCSIHRRIRLRLPRTADDRFSEPGNVIPIGHPPIRVDFHTQISGVDWPGAWENRIETTLAGIPVHVICRECLIRNKKAIGRPGIDGVPRAHPGRRRRTSKRATPSPLGCTAADL